MGLVARVHLHVCLLKRMYYSRAPTSILCLCQQQNLPEITETPLKPLIGPISTYLNLRTGTSKDKIQNEKLFRWRGLYSSVVFSPVIFYIWSRLVNTSPRAHAGNWSWSGRIKSGKVGSCLHSQVDDDEGGFLIYK